MAFNACSCVASAPLLTAKGSSDLRARSDMFSFCLRLQALVVPFIHYANAFLMQCATLMGQCALQLPVLFLHASDYFVYCNNHLYFLFISSIRANKVIITPYGLLSFSLDAAFKGTLKRKKLFEKK